MITNLRLNLDDQELSALGLLLNGKKSKATRAQVADWATKTLKAALDPASKGPTELKSFLCPKCNKPIALPVPAGKVEKPRPERFNKAADKTRGAIEALIRELEALKQGVTEL